MPHPKPASGISQSTLERIRKKIVWSLDPSFVPDFISLYCMVAPACSGF